MFKVRWVTPKGQGTAFVGDIGDVVMNNSSPIVKIFGRDAEGKRELKWVFPLTRLIDIENVGEIDA